MNDGNIYYFDFFEYSRNDLLDFFIEPLINSLIKVEEKNNLQINFFNREDGEISMAVYLSGILASFVFYEDRKKDKRDILRFIKKNRLSKGYNYLLARLNADAALISVSCFDVRELISPPIQSLYRMGEINYSKAAFLKKSIDNKESTTYFALRNLSDNFEDYSIVVKNSFEEAKLSREEIIEKIDSLLGQYTNEREDEDKKVISTHLSILSNLIK